MDAYWLILAGAGVAAGILGGLLGIGGGALMMPVLIATFLGQGYPEQNAGLLAVGTSLIPVCLLSVRAFLSHRRRGAGRYRHVLTMAPGGVVGALLGAEAALYVGGALLIQLFAAFEILLGLRFLLRPGGPEGNTQRARSGVGTWSLVGLLSGFISSLLGVGGGIVAVPLQLLLLSIPIHSAVANSSGLIFINAAVGVARYAATPTPSGIDQAWGWVDPRAGLILAVAAILTVPIGVAAAHRLERRGLRRIFGAFLLLVGVWLLLGV